MIINLLFDVSISDIGRSIPYSVNVKNAFWNIVPEAKFSSNDISNFPLTTSNDCAIGAASSMIPLYLNEDNGLSCKSLISLFTSLLGVYKKFTLLISDIVVAVLNVTIPWLPDCDTVTLLIVCWIPADSKSNRIPE